MHQRTIAPVAALVFIAGCASGTPAASPSPSPEPTPAPSRSSSPSSTVPGSGARITVFKVWDADGNATTTNDRETFAVGDFPPGAYPLEFTLDVEGSGSAAPEVSTIEPQGDEQMVFQIESDQESVMVTLTEIRKDGSTLVGGHCYDAATQAIVMGITGGDAVTLEIAPNARIGCTFINTPVPDLGPSN